MNPSPWPPLRRRLPTPAVPSTRQRGVVAIALAVLAVAAVGAALGSFMLQRAQTRQVDVQGQWAMLQWADRAVRGYALANEGKLPCPASTPNGFASCGQGSKGWLPVASLVQVTGTAPPQDVIRLNVRYMVNRGASGGGGAPFDLTQEDPPTFTPLNVAGEPVAGWTDASSSVDLCARLRGIALSSAGGVGGAGAPRWGVGDDVALTTVATVAEGAMAYGVAVAAPRAADAASGVNANLGLAKLESPFRPVDQTYTDLVSVTQPAAYFKALGCGALMASLDGMAMAQTWSDVALGQREGNIAAGEALGEIVMMAALADAMYLLVSLGDMANGIFNLGENAAKLIAAIASLQFYKIPNYIQGMTIAPVGMAVSIIDLVRIAVALALDAMIADAYFTLAEDARNLPVWGEGVTMLQKAHQAGLSAAIPPPVDGATGDGGTGP